MRTDHACPMCDRGEVAYVETVLDQNSGGRGELALIQPRAWSSKVAGQFEVYFCPSCGFAEWYVKSPQGVGKHSNSKALIQILKARRPESS